MVEYAVVSVFLMLMIWYAIIGGSGDWLDPTRVENHGNLSKSPPSSAPPPSVVNAMKTKQNQFAHDIYQP